MPSLSLNWPSASRRTNRVLPRGEIRSRAPRVRDRLRLPPLRPRPMAAVVDERREELRVRGRPTREEPERDDAPARDEARLRDVDIRLDAPRREGDRLRVDERELPDLLRLAIGYHSSVVVFFI